MATGKVLTTVSEQNKAIFFIFFVSKEYCIMSRFNSTRNGRIYFFPNTIDQRISYVFVVLK